MNGNITSPSLVLTGYLTFLTLGTCFWYSGWYQHSEMLVFDFPTRMPGSTACRFKISGKVICITVFLTGDAQLTLLYREADKMKKIGVRHYYSVVVHRWNHKPSSPSSLKMSFEASKFCRCVSRVSTYRSDERGHHWQTKYIILNGSGSWSFTLTIGKMPFGQPLVWISGSVKHFPPI